MSRTLAIIPAARYLNGTGHGVRLTMSSQLRQLVIVRFAAYHPSNPGLTTARRIFPTGKQLHYVGLVLVLG